MTHEDDVETRFKRYTVDVRTGAEMSYVRQSLEAVAKDLADRLPPGHERTSMLVKLEEATFWAVASLARAYGDPE